MNLQTLSKSQKDYLETIWFLSQGEDEELASKLVRIKDIASTLGVAPPSVVEYVQRLKAQGKVNVVPRKGVSLTQKGIVEAKLLQNRHRIVECYLKNVLGLEAELATLQASSTEHIIHPKLLEAMFKHIQESIKCPQPSCEEPYCTINPTELIE